MNFRNLRGRVGKLFVSGAVEESEGGVQFLFSITPCLEWML